MTEITSYLDGPFPMDVPIQDGQWMARLFATAGDKVYGATYLVSSYDGQLSFHGAREWDADGIHSASHRSLNLIPPPAARARAVSGLADEIAEIEKRIAENPTAPPAWIERDRQTIAVLVSRIRAVDPDYEP